MKDIGVKLSLGRVSHYEKIVRYWKDKYKTASVDEGKEIFPDFVSSIFEIRDFIDIYDAFKDVPVNKLSSIIEKLQKGVNGPINSAEEDTNSTIARNFIFEAVVAARSHRPGNGTEVILNAESDTGIRMGNKKVWVECKRITTPEKIYDNVRKASSQLERLLRKKAGSGHRGIVAIDISKILNSGDKIHVADTYEQINSSAATIMDRFIDQYSTEWERVYKRRNKKIIGTIIRFAYMSVSEVNEIFVHTMQWAVNPRIGISASDNDLQRSLVTMLNNEM